MDWQEVMNGKADAAQSVVDLKEVMNRQAGACKNAADWWEEYCGQAGSYEQGSLMQASILRTGRKL